MHSSSGRVGLQNFFLEITLFNVSSVLNGSRDNQLHGRVLDKRSCLFMLAPGMKFLVAQDHNPALGPARPKVFI